MRGAASRPRMVGTCRLDWGVAHAVRRRGRRGRKGGWAGAGLWCGQRRHLERQLSNHVDRVSGHRRCDYEAAAIRHRERCTAGKRPVSLRRAQADHRRAARRKGVRRAAVHVVRHLVASDGHAAARHGDLDLLGVAVRLPNARAKPEACAATARGWQRRRNDSAQGGGTSLACMLTAGGSGARARTHRRCRCASRGLRPAP